MLIDWVRAGIVWTWAFVHVSFSVTASGGGGGDDATTFFLGKHMNSTLCEGDCIYICVVLEARRQGLLPRFGLELS